MRVHIFYTSNFNHLALVHDEVVFFGHPNVRCLHARTIEITRHEHLSLRGDCIAGVRANKACSDLDEVIKNRLRKDGAYVKLELIVGNESLSIAGRGHNQLTLQDSDDIVTRTSQFLCPRTLTVGCDKAAVDIPRGMVNALQSSEVRGLLRIQVE